MKTKGRVPLPEGEVSYLNNKATDTFLREVHCLVKVTGIGTYPPEVHPTMRSNVVSDFRAKLDAHVSDWLTYIVCMIYKLEEEKSVISMSFSFEYSL
jgi:hypothetical protein